MKVITNDVETQIKELILDDEFTSLQSLVNEEVNLMSILRVSHRELQHSNILAWLFTPNESHRLGDFFIKEFIKLYFKENEYVDLGHDMSSISVFDFINMNFEDLEIRREEKNIDLLLLSKENQLCICIENKIYSGEGKGQLKKYRYYVEETYTDYKYKIFIYLSLFPQEITESEQEYYVQINYDHIKKILKLILDQQIQSLKNNTRFVIEQYLKTLNTLMNENEQIEKIAKSLYSKYRSAFDLVFKYAKPNDATIVPNNLNELIEREEGIVPFTSSKTYLRFTPKFLLENVDAIVEKGYLKAKDDLTQSPLFLFEFYVQKDRINFDMKIGMYAHQECRKALYDLYSSHPEVFKKVVKPSGKISSKWHLAYQYPIVKKTEYENYLQSEVDNLDELIYERFRKLIDIELPKIRKVILESLN